MNEIRTKRVYDSLEKDDGTRVLVDRMWPRGLTKDQVKYDLWLKDAAPSTDLRKWFNHDPSKWESFKRKYIGELETRPEIAEKLLEFLDKKNLTLLYSAHDFQHNQAVALKEYLLSLGPRDLP